MSANIARKVRRLPRAERIHDIIGAAREAFATNGYHETSMVEIAAKAGVAEGTIYKFFDSKRSLLIAILRDWHLAMIRDNQSKLAGVQGTRARLRVVIWQHLKTIRDDPDLCRLFYSEVRSNADYRETELYVLNRQVTQLLVTVLDEGVHCGDLRPDIDLRLVRDIVFGGIEHRVSRFLAGLGHLEIGALSDSMTELIMSGIAQQRGQGVDQARFDQALDRLEQMTDRMDRA